LWIGAAIGSTQHRNGHGAPGKQHSVSVFRRILACAIAASLAASVSAAAPASANAGPDPQADAALSAVVARNASLHDYTFDVTAHIALLTFPWIRFTLQGHGEYTKDGTYLVHFDRVPWFGKGFETISMASLDPKTWPDEYTFSLEKPAGTSTVLSLHDRKHTSLDETLVTIDNDRTVREIRWNYAHGGHVRLSIVPQEVAGYALPQSEEAEIVMNTYRAMADATFSNYRVNTLARSGQPHGDAQEPVVQGSGQQR
jgi:hypothetical protein